MFQNLLLAIDDSPSGEVALDFATAFAERSSATVHVFHVNEYLVGGRGVTLHTRAEASELVMAAVEQLRAKGIRASGSACIASYRDVADCIAEAAHERSADAIVLGSRRSRRFARLFSLQVRERTMRRTSLPVLTAPSPLELTSSGWAETISAWQLQAQKRSGVRS